MQIALNTPRLVILGLLLSFAVFLVLLGMLLHVENKWLQLTMLVSVLPLLWIAGALIFSQQEISTYKSPNVELSGLRGCLRSSA